MPPLSARVAATDAPVIADVRALVDSVPGCCSLAQGVVSWAPPPAALEAAVSASGDPSTSAYGPDLGVPALRKAVVDHLAACHGLDGALYRAAVTPGANFALGALALALLDPGDTQLDYTPHYFNERMVSSAGASAHLHPPGARDITRCEVEWSG